MKTHDEFSDYYADLLDGRYDCVDRIVLNGYFALGQQGGGFRYWWRQLTGSDATLDPEHLRKMAGRFSRRVHAYAKRRRIPLRHCDPGVRKHELAEQYRPQDPTFTGVFLILVAKAPALVWEVTKSAGGVPHLTRKTPWPYVNHYHFHILDKDWGHLTVKVSGHPPFGLQVLLNGHEWVERRARKRAVPVVKDGNCFVEGSDVPALDRLAASLCDAHAINRLAKVCERWVYASCLCFALTRDEQARSGFRYQYSCYQLEYSRNLLFTRGTVLDEIYQGLLDRTRRALDVPTLRTIFGAKHRPHRRRGGRAPRLERVLDGSVYDLTVLKLHFGPLTLKLYDKGARVLRIEVIVHSVKALRCGKRLEKLSILLARLQRMVIDFLNVIYAAHRGTLAAEALDTLPLPTQRGAQRLAGVDLQKPRMRAVVAAVLALAPKPEGFTAQDVVDKTRPLLGPPGVPYTPRQAAYDLAKLRGKTLVERVGATRRYQAPIPGVQTLAALLILREKVIKPVLAGAATPKPGPRPERTHPLDVHYDNLQRELRRTFETLGLAA
jgi:hypothetical protein